MFFSKNIKKLLADRQMKIADLARELKISPQRAGRYANGQNEPNFETLAQLGQLFDVAIDDLILVDLSQGGGRRYGEGAADGGGGEDADAQLKELNKLLRLRVAELERNLKETDPGLAEELGIE